MKSIRDWISSIDNSAFRKNLQEAVDPARMDTMVYSLADAIAHGIPSWQDTELGVGYWLRQWEKAASGRVIMVHNTERRSTESSTTADHELHASGPNYGVSFTRKAKPV